MTAGRFTAAVAGDRANAAVRRALTRVTTALGEDVRRLREDGGLTRARLADGAGVDRTFLGRIEDGAPASLRTYARLASILGADLSARLYPNTGPVIRDRHQARMLELLLSQLHPRWDTFTEVAVRRPARGWIDLVLHDARDATVVAVEIQSTLPRLEQLVRWSAEKAASLASWEGYVHLGGPVATSQLLLVRSTRTNRDIGRQFRAQLEAAFPEHPDDALDSLSGTRPWPGASLVWIDLRPDSARFLRRR